MLLQWAAGSSLPGDGAEGPHGPLNYAVRVVEPLSDTIGQGQTWPEPAGRGEGLDAFGLEG